MQTDQERGQKHMIKLSEREQKVLALYLEKGHLTEVAEALGRSLLTVRNQRAAVMRKLGARNQIQLAIRAMEKGLVKA